jgi:hypothetical protein
MLASWERILMESNLSRIQGPIRRSASLPWPWHLAQRGHFIGLAGRSQPAGVCSDLRGKDSGRCLSQMPSISGPRFRVPPSPFPPPPTCNRARIAGGTSWGRGSGILRGRGSGAPPSPASISPSPKPSWPRGSHRHAWGEGTGVGGRKPPRDEGRTSAAPDRPDPDVWGMEDADGSHRVSSCECACPTKWNAPTRGRSWRVSAGAEALLAPW